MPAQNPQQQRHTAEYVTLRDYIDTRLEAVEKEKEAAYRTMEKRLDGMNEFRDALKDQNATFLTKTEYCLFKEAVEKDIRSLRESRSQLEGKASQSTVNMVTIISVVSLLIGLTGLILRFMGV